MNLQALSTLVAGAAPPQPEGVAGQAAGTRKTTAAASDGADVLVDGAAPGGVAFATGAPAGAPRTKSSGAKRASGAGYAKTSSATAKKTAAKSASSKTTSTVPKDLAFLSDPKLSVEEKLFRFMQYFAAKYDEQLEAKMKEIAGKQPASKTSSTSGTKKKKKGLLGRIGGALKTFLPAAGIALDLLQTKAVQTLLKQLSGPVLSAAATALGFPQLAPVLLKAGPEVAGALASLAKELDTAGGGTTKKTSSSSSSSSSSTSSSGTQEISQADAMALQRLQEKQKEMFALVSNILRAMHDSKMAVINNVRA